MSTENKAIVQKVYDVINANTLTDWVMNSLRTVFEISCK